MKHLKRNGFAALALAGAIGVTGCAPAAPAPTTATPAESSPATEAAPETATNAQAATPAQSEEKKSPSRIIKAENPETNPQHAKDRKDTIIVGMQDFNGIFNPLFSDSLYDTYANNILFDGVFDMDKEGNIIGGMCDYTIDNPTQITLKLKDGIKFSNGQEVTADDIITSYLIVLDPKYDGAYDLLKYEILGSKEYYEGNATSVSGIKKVDDRTVQINIAKPNSEFISAIGTPILPAAYYNYKKGDIESLHALDTKPIGAGPYKLVSFKEGQEIVFEANENYWQGAPKVKNIIYKVVPSATNLQTVVAGDVDIQMVDANTDNVGAVQEAGFLDLHIFPTNGYGYLGFSSKANPIFADAKVRQAIAYSINRKDAVANIYGEFGNVNNLPQSKVSPYYTEENVNPYEFDMEKSKALLEEAGWKKGSDGILEKDGKKFTVNLAGIADNPVLDVLIPEVIKSFKELGIDLKVEYVEFPTLVDRVDKDKAEMWFMSWHLSPGPNSQNFFGTGKPQNYYNYSNPELDKLYEQALAEMDPDKNKAIWQETYRIINRDLPLIPMYQRSDMWAVNHRVKGMDGMSPYREFAVELYKASIEE